ncbi:hypothetical protein Syun_003716 [Stephania yunnanensis]|uniref:Uncharacterized protein n=1 Tax=Stephania yunnanensis TaxID=152371 RepID=A0AAP0L461_9MAGN
MEDYLIETFEECEFFQNDPEIVIALNEGEDEMKIDVNSDKPENPQIESEEDQLLVLVQPPTLPCTFGTPYKVVEVRERLQIFYTADTFVFDELDTTDSFVLEVLDELLNLKEGVHASLPNYGLMSRVSGAQIETRARRFEVRDFSSGSGYVKEKLFKQGKRCNLPLMKSEGMVTVKQRLKTTGLSTLPNLAERAPPS